MGQTMPFPMPIKVIGDSENAVDLDAWRDKIRQSKHIALLAAECWPTLLAMIAVFQEEILRRMHEEGTQELPVVDADGVLDGRAVRAKYMGLDILTKQKSRAAVQKIHDVKYKNSPDPFIPKEAPSD